MDAHMQQIVLTLVLPIVFIVLFWLLLTKGFMRSGFIKQAQDRQQSFQDQLLAELRRHNAALEQQAVVLSQILERIK